jgi:hypothetical protein
MKAPVGVVGKLIVVTREPYPLTKLVAVAEV